MFNLRCCLLLALLFISLLTPARAEETAHVLLLNSYHNGLDWTDNEISGIREVLAGSPQPIELHYEYMDTKRIADATHFANFRELLAYKYRSTRFAAILTTDNDAFNFLKIYRNDPAFNRVPVIFTGVNFFQPSMLDGLHGFTGVAETQEGGQTVAAMLRLHPETKRIVIILDATTTGSAIRRDLEPMLTPYAARVQFEYWDQYSLKQLPGQLATLDPGTLVLLMPFARDSSNTFITYADMAGLVSRSSPSPVYGTYDFYMGHGIAGGRLTSGVAQGRAAAELLLQVLSGTRPEQIPVVTVTPSEFQFDTRELARRRIAISDLPPGSQLLFQPWYRTYQTRLWLGGALLLLTQIMLWGWWRTYRVKRQNELQLEHNREQLAAILNATTESVFHVDENGMILALNDIAAHRLNRSPQEMRGQYVFDFFPPEVARKRRDNLACVFRTGQGIYTEDTREQRYYSLNYYPIVDKDGHVGSVVVYAADITERKLSEIALHESHQQVHLLLNSMAEGAYGVDTEGRCKFVNQSFLRILGYEREDEIIGQPIHELIHHTHTDGRPYASTDCKMYQAYRNNLPVHVDDEVFWSKSGTAIPVEYWSQPILVDGLMQGAIATFIDITERRQAEAQISHLAFYDTLTQLPNRRLLNDRLGQAIAACQRNRLYAALLFLDLDNFKPLNDLHGHATGDLLLIEAAHRLGDCIRETDTAARFGGDEFVVILGELHQDQEEATRQARLVADKILTALSEPYFLNSAQDERGPEYRIEHHCTTSIGMAIFNHPANRDDILKWADIAMYTAKQGGRNHVVVYQPAPALRPN